MPNGFLVWGGDKMLPTFIPHSTLCPKRSTVPMRFLKGLRFDDDEPRHCDSQGWRCYAKHPARRYNDKGGTFATPKGRIFLVFVDTDKIVYNWTWDETDEEALVRGEHLPVDYKTRFDKQIYWGE